MQHKHPPTARSRRRRPRQLDAAPVGPHASACSTYTSASTVLARPLAGCSFCRHGSSITGGWSSMQLTAVATSPEAGSSHRRLVLARSCRSRNIAGGRFQHHRQLIPTSPRLVPACSCHSHNIVGCRFQHHRWLVLARSCHSRNIAGGRFRHHRQLIPTSLWLVPACSCRSRNIAGGQF